MSKEKFVGVQKDPDMRAALRWLSKHAAELFETTKVEIIEFKFQFPGGKGFTSKASRMEHEEITGRAE
jgi:hypothetical protein